MRVKLFLFLLSLRDRRQARPSFVIPASARESSVVTITLLWRLRLLMRTNLFNGLVIQTVVFTLIPWILDQVEDDTQSLSSLRDRRRPGLLLSFRLCHNYIKGKINDIKVMVLSSKFPALT